MRIVGWRRRDSTNKEKIAPKLNSPQHFPPNGSLRNFMSRSNAANPAERNVQSRVDARVSRCFLPHRPLECQRLTNSLCHAVQQKHQQVGSKPTARQTATVNRTVKKPGGCGEAQLSSIPNSSVDITHNAMDEIPDLIQGLFKICSHLSGMHFSSIPYSIDDIHPPSFFSL